MSSVTAMNPAFVALLLNECKAQTKDVSRWQWMKTTAAIEIVEQGMSVVPALAQVLRRERSFLALDLLVQIHKKHSPDTRGCQGEEGRIDEWLRFLAKEGY